VWSYPRIPLAIAALDSPIVPVNHGKKSDNSGITDSDDKTNGPIESKTAGDELTQNNVNEGAAATTNNEAAITNPGNDVNDSYPVNGNAITDDSTLVTSENEGASPSTSVSCPSGCHASPVLHGLPSRTPSALISGVVEQTLTTPASVTAIQRTLSSPVSIGTSVKTPVDLTFELVGPPHGFQWHATFQAPDTVVVH
jgi:hypothetical protein